MALGVPDLVVCGFQLWVHGYAYDASADNWLRVTAHVGADGANVWTSGVLLESTDIAHFRRGVASMHGTLEGEALLSSMEANISVVMRVTDAAGHVSVRAEMRPTYTHGHWFEFFADQSYLPTVLSQCDVVLERFPVR
jgi:hypothetical protein